MNVLHLVEQDEVTFGPGVNETKEGNCHFLMITRPVKKHFSNSKFSYKKIYIYGSHECHRNLNIRNPYSEGDYIEELSFLVNRVNFYYSPELIIKSDQYSHKTISGRFYQFFENEKSIAASVINCYEIARAIIESEDIQHVITREVRDANKIGVMIACWELGVPFHTLEPSGVAGKFFGKTYLREGHDIVEKFCSLQRNATLFHIRNFDYGEDFLTDSNTSSKGFLESTREWHTHKMRGFWRETVSIFLRSFLRIVFTPFILLLNASYLRNSGMIPFHKKNIAAVLIAELGIPLFLIRGRCRALWGRCYSYLFKERVNQTSSVVVPLHYFPESTTISGKSWRNVKSEVDLFSDQDFQKAIANENIILFEHPAYRNYGDRSMNFFKKIKSATPDVKIYKWSRGVDLKQRPRAVISISGSILFEAARDGIPAYMVKCSPLLFVDGIQRIDAFIAKGSSNSPSFLRTRGISPNEYELVCSEHGLKRDQISYQLLIDIFIQREFKWSTCIDKM